jgi:hypothetical protein
MFFLIEKRGSILTLRVKFEQHSGANFIFMPVILIYLFCLN